MFGRRCCQTTIVIPDLDRIQHKVNKILKFIVRQEILLMATREELDAKLTEVSGKLDEVIDDQGRVLGDLSRIKDELAAALEAGDVSGALAKVTEMGDKLDAAEGALEAASPEPEVPTEPETPEVPAEETPGDGTEV